MEINLKTNQYTSSLMYGNGSCLFNFRWSYKDVGYQYYKTCTLTVRLEDNNQADRIYFDINLN